MSHFYFDVDWTDYWVYLPYYIGMVRFLLTLIFKMIPALWYREYSEKDVEKLCQKYGEQTKKFTGDDVTIIIPAYQPPYDFKETLLSLLKQKPHTILLAADTTCYKNLRNLAAHIPHEGRIKVLEVKDPGKRVAMAAGLKHVQTDITIFVDDDVRWDSENFLDVLLMPFSDPKMGGVGPKQIVRPKFESREKLNIYETMSDIRLSMRYLELRTMAAVDKGASCISGRTMAFRTSIIQCEDFYDKFLNEKFFGMQLQSGDDKCITRYVINNGHRAYHQLSNRCRLSTTMESGEKCFFQTLRWSRNTFRSDFSGLFVERNIWKYRPFSALMLLDKTFTPFFMLYGLVFVPVYTLIIGNLAFLVVWMIWLVFSRIIKIANHLIEHPLRIFWIPIFVGFQYILMGLKIYAIFTCNNRSWITRSVKVGKDNKIVRTGEEAEKQQKEPEVDEENPPQVEVSKEKSAESLNEIVVE